ncbi:related to TIP41 - negatively regulates the TOR signaling pathway [Melanopsichium pennsylvanicum]|uniref:Related to TIP41 - negatively regulates the TOR signaling pathway n=2 Tax=Melanopsichium pennsylvanicum TaxID=63383 RepID=A0AAJ5C3J5_9BASI|nr:related to TIP41-negatively regulates the TOR signaling pathway [Melanopsichium pennsylvanicum 4]SNX82696.1 related to TIP41 - negatively regulates the TOR signaling pathway [Melanopsichium pennsylvanicum]
MSGPTTWSHRAARSATSTTSSSSSASVPTSTAPSAQPTTRGIDLGGWSVRVTSGPIGSSAEMDALSDVLGIPPPEMAFPHNSLVLQHTKSGFNLCFDAVRTLRSVDGVQSANRLYGIDCRDVPTKRGKSSVPGAKPKGKGGNGIKVAYAKEWGKSRTEFVGSTPANDAKSSHVQSSDPSAPASHFGTSTDITAAKDYDWTYSTTWPGALGHNSPQTLLDTQIIPALAPNLAPALPATASLSSQDQSHWFSPGTDPSTDRIPVERLGPSSGEPILFYDDIVLYEDELADNGSSIVNVKVRVMPSGFLVLQRFFLRVDDVIFRVFDTRLYCQFAPPPVPRGIQSTFSSTARRDASKALPTTLGQLSLGTPRNAASARVQHGEDMNMPTRNKAGDKQEEEEEEEGFYPRLIRECSGSEAPYSVVRSHLPPYKPHDLSPLTDMNWVSNTLTKISRSKSSSYYASVASGAQLPRLDDKDASPGAKFLTPSTPAARYPGTLSGFPGARPGERMDLSPAQAPFASTATGTVGSAQVIGEIHPSPTDDEDREEWVGCGARVDVAVLKPRH